MELEGFANKVKIQGRQEVQSQAHIIPSAARELLKPAGLATELIYPKQLVSCGGTSFASDNHNMEVVLIAPCP